MCDEEHVGGGGTECKMYLEKTSAPAAISSLFISYPSSQASSDSSSVIYGPFLTMGHSTATGEIDPERPMMEGFMHLSHSMI